MYPVFLLCSFAQLLHKLSRKVLVIYSLPTFIQLQHKVVTPKDTQVLHIVVCGARHALIKVRRCLQAAANNEIVQYARIVHAVLMAVGQAATLCRHQMLEAHRT